MTIEFYVKNWCCCYANVMRLFLILISFLKVKIYIYLSKKHHTLICTSEIRIFNTDFLTTEYPFSIVYLATQI